jgi:hypothetical protein
MARARQGENREIAITGRKHVARVAVVVRRAARAFP